MTTCGSELYASPLLKQAFLDSNINVKHDLEKSEIFSFGITIL